MADSQPQTLPALIGLCPSTHLGEFYMPLKESDTTVCPCAGCPEHLYLYVPKEHYDEALSVLQPGESRVAVPIETLEAIGARAEDAEAERDALRDGLAVMSERVMRFGGVQRTERGNFWISRDDVLRLIDETLTAAPLTRKRCP